MTSIEEENVWIEYLDNVLAMILPIADQSEVEVNPITPAIAEKTKKGEQDA